MTVLSQEKFAKSRRLRYKNIFLEKDVKPEKEERKAGIVIPVFSLRSNEGLGVGEFSDLRLLADFAAKSGFSVIQLLPFWDTTVTGTWVDSYCYAPISLFALHPLYLRIEEAFSDIPSDVAAEIRKVRADLNRLDRLDYERAYTEKIAFCRKLYDREKHQNIPDSFLMERREYLLPYLAFSALRDAWGTADYSLWEGYENGSEEIILSVCSPESKYYPAVRFYLFLQYKLHEQLSKVVTYAESLGVVLKGDFPVGVHAKSVDTWSCPDLFLLSQTLGAPPDVFNVRGQNWHLPAYNWEKMEVSGYRWFVDRLRYMAMYCRLVRIDHVLGYLRFWQIPLQYYRGALGYFSPSKKIKYSDLPPCIVSDLDRYTKPFITDPILEEYFGGRVEYFKNNFFEKIEGGRYRFFSLYEKQIALYSVTGISSEEREILLRFHENVLLLPDPSEADFFYPRLGMESTDSFKTLDPAMQIVCQKWLSLYEGEEEEKLWKQEGLKKLQIFSGATDMEICVEDLGMLPRCTGSVLQTLGFLRLHIQRMPEAPDREFDHPGEYEYASVCSPSNHDTSPLRVWWEENKEVTRRYYRNVLRKEGDPPEQLTEELCEEILRMHLDSPAKWAIFLLQDLLAIDPERKNPNPLQERINDPAISPFYWRWRLHISLEELLKADDFIARLQKAVSASGRSLPRGSGS